MEQLCNTFFWRLPYLRLMFIVLSGFALGNLAIIAFAQSTRPALTTNPFAEYTDIFPGQTSQAPKSGTLTCSDMYTYNRHFEKSCSMHLDSDIFSRIEILTNNDVIRQTTFTLRDNTLKIGDLALLFNISNFHPYPRKVFFFWNNLFVIVSTTASGNHPSMRPVWSVTFTDRY